MKITDIRVDHFRIPLDPPLSDSTHGLMTTFGLVTVRITVGTGHTGLGYTYTVGDIGTTAIHRLIEENLVPWLLGRDANAIDRLAGLCFF